jgi:hypothetical protein
MSQVPSPPKRCAACGEETDQLFDHFSETNQRYYKLCNECIFVREDNDDEETYADAPKHLTLTEKIIIAVATVLFLGFFGTLTYLANN